MTGSPVIEVEDLALTLSARHKTSVAQSLKGAVGGAIVRDQSGANNIEVLKNINFAIRQGQAVGLVGLNGSGKSSLLRILAGIYSPTSGKCSVHGQISTLFSNQLGLIPQASAVENIKTMATLMDLPTERVPALIEDVIEFSQLGEYVNLPVKTYSAGMRVRIGFGVATSLQPDVLLIDEVFGTGDHNFVKNARKRLQNMMTRSGAIVMAGHSSALLKQYCSHAIWLDRGKMMAFDSIESVLEKFQNHIASVSNSQK